MDYAMMSIIIAIIGVLIPCFFWLIKRNKANKEIDRQIYKQYFKYEFEQLFEEAKFKNKDYKTNDKYWMSNTDNFNVPDNVKMCQIVIEFINRENKFKLRIANGKLKKMRTICEDIEKLIETKNFKWENLRDNSGYARIYNENKELFKSFKDSYIIFYKSLFSVY